MEKIRVAVPSGKQCYQLTTDDGNKYFYGDNGELEGNVFVASVNPLEVVDEADKETLGLVSGTGNIIIPFNKKNIERIKGAEYYLVSESNITDFKVKEALNKKNDPGFKLQDSSSEDEKSIKDQMIAEMSRDGKSAVILFSDMYSQVCLYDLTGSKIEGTDSSFIGKNDIAIYFHDNVKGTSSNRMKVEMKTEEVAADVQAPTVAEEIAPTEQTPVDNNFSPFQNPVENSETLASIPSSFNQESTSTLDASFDPALTINDAVSNISVANDVSPSIPTSIDKVEEVALPKEISTTLDEIKLDTPIDIPEEIHEEEMFKEPEKPDELISEAIDQFEAATKTIDNLKQVINKKDKNYEDMVHDYETKIVRSNEEHKGAVDELTTQYETQIAKLKNHGANWQNRYQRANARAEVLDEEGKKKSDTIEKLRGQLRDSYEEVSALKEKGSILTAKLKSTEKELKKEQEAHTSATERADNLQDENNRLVAGRSKLLENINNMTKQINSVETLVKDVKKEPIIEDEHESIDLDDKYDFDDEPKKDLVDFSLGDSLKEKSFSFDNLDDLFKYDTGA